MRPRMFTLSFKKAYFISLFTIMVVAGCNSLFFYPQKQLIDDPVVRGFSPQDVYFKTPDGLTLHGWFLRTHKEPRATILVLHGNAENLSTHVRSVLWLAREGFNIFIFDYRGYGRSEGKPTIKGIHLDAEAALEKLFTLPGVTERIIVLGQSLGGAAAVYTVANSPYKNRINALVIDSAFSSYRLIAREKLARVIITWPFQYPLSLLFSDHYSPVKWIKNVSPVPILILHGKQDAIVPFHHGRMLYDAALPPKELWETSPPGHIMSFADEQIRKILVNYLSTLLSEQ